MSALDTGAVLIEHGNIWVGDDAGSVVDMGAVRNVKFTGKQIHTKIDSDNRGTIINKVRMNGEIMFDLLEAGDAASLENIFKGIITLGSNAATPVVGGTQALASPFVPNEFYEFTGQQASGLVPTSISVSGATDGVLTLDDDYFIFKNPNTGKWGIILTNVAAGVTLTTLSQVVTITSSYTPAASATLTGGTNQTATPRYVKIIGPSEDSDAVTRTIILSAAIATSDMVIEFVEVENANDVGKMQVKFENNKGESWTYTDQVNPA